MLVTRCRPVPDFRVRLPGLLELPEIVLTQSQYPYRTEVFRLLGKKVHCDAGGWHPLTTRSERLDLHVVRAERTFPRRAAETQRFFSAFDCRVELFQFYVQLCRH